MNLTISIEVVILDESLQFNFLREKTKRSKSLFKLIGVKLSITVNVKLLDRILKTSKSNTSSTLNMHFELKIKFFYFHIKTNSVEHLET